MRRMLRFSIAFMVVVGCLCMNTTAFDSSAFRITVPERESKAEGDTRAPGSFNMSEPAYGRSETDKTFPLEAGENVKISAVYTPKNASVDFGLIDSDGVFHYVTITDGNIDISIQTNQNGNYKFAVRNNSSKTVRMSGFLQY